MLLIDDSWHPDANFKGSILFGDWGAFPSSDVLDVAQARFKVHPVACLGHLMDRSQSVADIGDLGCHVFGSSLMSVSSGIGILEFSIFVRSVS